MIYDSIDQLIGNTPLLKIPAHVTGLKNIELYAKMEMLNPFGSVKDRIGKALLDEVLPMAIEKKQTIVEASSGNTARALSALCGVNGLQFKAITNRIRQPEVRQALQILNADIQELRGTSECPDPNDPDDYHTVAKNLAASDPEKYHYTDQYFNPENLQTHYRTTGKEILDDLKQVDFYFGFLGTCGSSMGVGQYLLDHNQKSQIWGVVTKAAHYIPGGRTQTELWEVGFYKQDFFEGILAENEQDAIDGILTLSRQCGVLCGPSAGATFSAALKKLREVDASYDGCKTKKKAAFIVCDRIDPYMTYLRKHRPSLFEQLNEGEGQYSKKRISSLTMEELELVDQITPENLKEKIDSNERHLRIIDIRGNHAFSLGHIEGSMNILEENFEQLIEEGPIFSENDEVVLCCPQGTHSVKYAAFLIQQGIRASNLKGGLIGWRNAGYSFQNGPVALAA